MATIMEYVRDYHLLEAAGVGLGLAVAGAALLRRRPRAEKPENRIPTEQDLFGDEGGCPTTDYRSALPAPRSAAEEEEGADGLEYAIAARTP